MALVSEGLHALYEPPICAETVNPEGKADSCPSTPLKRRGETAAADSRVSDSHGLESLPSRNNTFCHVCHSGLG